MRMNLSMKRVDLKKGTRYRIYSSGRHVATLFDDKEWGLCLVPKNEGFPEIDLEDCDDPWPAFVKIVGELWEESKKVGEANGLGWFARLFGRK